MRMDWIIAPRGRNWKGAGGDFDIVLALLMMMDRMLVGCMCEEGDFESFERNEGLRGRRII
jgi:hypothetical protein